MQMMETAWKRWKQTESSMETMETEYVIDGNSMETMETKQENDGIEWKRYGNDGNRACKW
jgi:hypothetical protein